MIIGTHAKAQSGKSTLTKLLTKHSGLPEYALSKPIKDIMNALFDWDDRHRDGELKEVDCKVQIDGRSHANAHWEWNVAGIPEKYGLQFPLEFGKIVDALDIKDYKLGKLYNTGIISPRQAYQNFGTEYGRRQIDEKIWLDMAPKNCILSDIRFENEATYVRKNGILIHLIRDDRNGIYNSVHESEKGVGRVDKDWLLYNNSSLQDLEKEAVRFLKHYEVI